MISGGSGGTSSGGTSSGGTSGGGGTSGAAAMLNAADIFHVLATANTGEVEQAEIAVERAQDAEVIDYAETMVTEHPPPTKRA